jgi:hypothetical protein
MPSRSAHRAALRRSQEPNVIAPEGVTLPELPTGMNWHNPVVGESTDRDEWTLLRVGPGGATVLARVRRNGASEADVSLMIAGSTFVPPPVTLPIAQAFDVAAKFARNSSR